MKEWMRKLTSRKLWLALAGVATGVAMAFGVDGDEITSVTGAVTALISVVTYVMTEGAVDMKSLESAAGFIGEEEDGDGGATA